MKLRELIGFILCFGLTGYLHMFPVNEDVHIANIKNDIHEENMNDKDYQIETVESCKYPALNIHYEESLSIKEFERYLEEYSYYFNLDSTKVINYVKENTDNYQNEFEFYIGNKKYLVDKSEFSALIIVHKLYSYPQNFGIDKKEFLINENIVNLNYDSNGNIIMRNGETFNDFLGRICNILNIDKALVLAISNTETGCQTSEQARFQNNFGGLRNSSGFYTYPSPEAGVVSLCVNIKRIKNTHDLTLEQLSGLYVNGNRNIPSRVWLKNVKYFYNDITNNPEKYFYIEKEYLLTKNNKTF